MHKKRFELQKTTCQRCGKDIYTGNRSLYGMDDLKAKYGRICSACMTEAERQEMDLSVRNRMGQIVKDL